MNKIRKQKDLLQTINATLQEKVVNLEMQKQKLNDLRLACKVCCKVR